MTTGPPMIKDENGVLVGYVFADIDQTQRDLGGWVADAKAIVASQLTLPAGIPAAVDRSVPSSSRRWKRGCATSSRSP